MKVITICRHNEENSSRDKIQSKSSENIQNGIKDAVDYIAKHKYHFTESLMNYAISKMQNSDNTDGRISKDTVENYMNTHGYTNSLRSNLYDITYTANMARADFYPNLLNDTDKCIEYALNVANDVDGYEGIEFCRWVADLMGKNIKIEWNNFI